MENNRSLIFSSSNFCQFDQKMNFENVPLARSLFHRANNTRNHVTFCSWTNQNEAISAIYSLKVFAGSGERITSAIFAPS